MVEIPLMPPKEMIPLEELKSFEVSNVWHVAVSSLHVSVMACKVGSMEMTSSPAWSSEQSSRPQLDGDNVSVVGVFESSTGSSCHVCAHVKTLPQNIFALQLLFPTVTLAANLLTTVAIYRSGEMKASLKHILIHLSLTDIVASLCYIYNIAFSWTHFKVNTECVVRYILFVSTQILTLDTIVFMSIDRCLAVMAPYLYSRIEGSTYAKIMTGINWTFSLVVGVVGFSHFNLQAEGCFYPILFLPFTHTFWAIGGLSSIVQVIVLNTILFTKARIHIRKIAATIPFGEARDQEMSRLEIKSILTTVSVVVPYVLLNTPIYVLMAVFVDQGPTFTHHSEALFLVNAFSSLSLLNALANPVIYIWRFEMVRKETLQIVGPLKGLFSPCCKRRHEEKDSEMVVSDEPAVERNRNSQCSGRSGVDTASTRVSVEYSARIFRDFSRSSQDYVTRISQDKGPDFGMSSQN
ncbi:RYamide receptor [Elysia marginata]|uniref:RYamide receptor n=1 Tax=Elysia marginata TaxID=1093978 RepID=A0AAV4EVF0_9GAST|nr:RYamide receptor [Elysia marginata]